ncbi:hypothetical protein GGI25_005239 [Coemansia spiralis]|uniref:Symplekin n=3 Tax=Coemansia TaxID=4863 RepID=A0A9W8G4J9_9FUNG|nr:hypothetical protein GGI26_005520 [Coemansia sp. RSA 1358]KAJ2672166.1 hypothetical protein GGI25_005239 [Coemansia spiralis]
MDIQALLNKANELYNQAVHETPPNRIKLDHLADLLCTNPQLLYSGFFEKGHEAASAVVNVGGMIAQEDEDYLSILTPPAAWGWTAIEQAVCILPPQPFLETKYPEYVGRFLALAKRTIDDRESTPMPIVRRAIQALTRFLPEILGLSISSKESISQWQASYETMIQLGDMLCQISERSDDPALQMYLVKFLETEAVLFTSQPSARDRAKESISLDFLPEPHPFINKPELAKRGDKAMLQLLRLLPNSDSIGLCNTSFITALINSIVYFMNLRPQFCQELLDKLTDWYAIINSYEQLMTHTQLVIIGKTLRISLLQLYTRPYMGTYSEVLENTLDKIGGNEWAAWQERQAKEKERRERYRARELSQIKPPKPLSRWVPSYEDDEVMADQPAPGDGDDAQDISPPPPPPIPSSVLEQRNAQSKGRVVSHGNKRPGGYGDDEDEEKQLQMMEENAKRVRLEEAKAQADAPANVDLAPGSDLQEATKMDVDIEDDVKAAVQTGPFDLQLLANMSSEERRKQLIYAVTRVIEGSKAVRKFIEHSRVRGSNNPSNSQSVSGVLINGEMAQEKSPQPILSNGLTTNYGVLEDSMLMLVRMVSNIYIMWYDICGLEDKDTQVEYNDMWMGMHSCVDTILESIAEAPRERYNLAITLLYEIWLAVVTTDPELENTPDKDEHKHSILALYFAWCDRILEAIVKDSMEATVNQRITQVVPEGVSEDSTQASNSAVPASGQQPQQAQPLQQQQKLDHLILDFVLEAPYIAAKSIEQIEVCLKTPATAALGFATLEKTMELRTPVMKPCLDVLLTYSVHPDRIIRVGCIRAVKRHYMTSKYTQLIEKYARTSMKHGIDTAKDIFLALQTKAKEIMDRPAEPPANCGDNHNNGDSGNSGEKAEEAKKAELAEVRKKGETNIENTLVSHMELPLALCTRNFNIISDLFSEYSHIPSLVQVAIFKIIVPLIKSMVTTPMKVLSVLKDFPEGAEMLALRIIYILCLDGPPVPLKELVQGVLDMCQTRNLDARFVLFIANGMDKAVLLRWLDPIVKLLGRNDGQAGAVKSSFIRMTTSYPGRPSVLSPTELLLAFHSNLSKETLASGLAAAAVDLFEGIRKGDGRPLFETSIIEAGLKLVQDWKDVAPLMLYTAEIYHSKRKGPAGMVIGLLAKLIERKAWEMDELVMAAFIRCFAVMQPGSLRLIKNIPSEGLKRLMEKAPTEFWAVVKDYVGKMPEGDRKELGWLLA